MHFHIFVMLALAPRDRFVSRQRRHAEFFRKDARCLYCASRRHVRIPFSRLMVRRRTEVVGAVMLTRTHFAYRCTTLPIAAMSFANGGAGSAGVSQGINVIYHAPASLQVFFLFFFFLVGGRVLKWVHDRGDKLRLINTSTTIGTRTGSARIEVSPSVGLDLNHYTATERVEVFFRLVVVGLGRDASSARCVCHAGQDGTVVDETVTGPTGVSVMAASEFRFDGWSQGHF